MTLIYPATADAFRCIADACRHTCCKGWEIDIDPNTRAKYAAMTGEIGQRLRDAIADTPDGASFRLREDERCPMLNDSGLCDIITACGEGALCQICADHPRYRNEFSTFTEVGFGLCCEAAADLTLHWPQPMTWHTQGGGTRPQGSPEEEALLQARAALIRIMQDRTRGIPARLNALCEAAGTVMPTRTAAEWADFLRTLERLDPAWDAAGFFPAGGGAVHGVPAASACAGGAAGWRFAGADAVLCGIGDAVPAPVDAAGRKRSGADVLIRNRILGGKPLLVSG